MGLGDNVFAWRTTPLQATELPAIVYRDRVETKEPGWGVNDYKLAIELEIYGNTVAEIRGCLAALEAAIFVDDTFGGLAIQSELNVNEMEIEQKEDIFVGSKILLIVNYRTVSGDPYTVG